LASDNDTTTPVDTPQEKPAENTEQPVRETAAGDNHEKAPEKVAEKPERKAEDRKSEERHTRRGESKSADGRAADSDRHCGGRRGSARVAQPGGRGAGVGRVGSRRDDGPRVRRSERQEDRRVVEDLARGAQCLHVSVIQNAKGEILLNFALRDV